jgi:hypothetical protein
MRQTIAMDVRGTIPIVALVAQIAALVALAIFVCGGMGSDLAAAERMETEA